MAKKPTITIPVANEKILKPAVNALINKDSREYKKYTAVILYGGRGGSKSHFGAIIAILRCLYFEGHVLCCREVQKSIQESVKSLIEQKIKDLNYQDSFDISQTSIRSLVKPNNMVFKGISTSYRTAGTIKSFENASFAYWEEAQSAEAKSLQLLVPTLRHDNGVKFLFVMNPMTNQDAVFEYFKGRKDALFVKINYEDNKYLPKALKKEAQMLALQSPDEYRHVWLGEPMGTEKPSVLPYNKLMTCFDLFNQFKKMQGGRYEVGYDAAASETGDYSAFAIRNGAFLNHVERFRIADTGKGAVKVHKQIQPLNPLILTYDATGVGAGVGSKLKEIRTTYKINPFLFGGKVAGEDRKFSLKTTNKDMFVNRTAQAWWLLRLRVQNTYLLSQGEKIDPELCLFIDPDQPEVEELKKQLSMIAFSYDPRGRIKIEKKENTNSSPDMADAVLLAFARESSRGLIYKKIIKDVV